MRIDRLQTMSCAFRDICQEEEPWVALGNFINYWFAYAKDRREELIADPLPVYEKQSEHQHQWALFCVASVEWLSRKYQVPCPAWVNDPCYATSLPVPWFLRDTDSAKARLLETTPEEFRRRNIYCGDDVYANKWEFIEQLPAVIAHFKQLRQTV